MFMASGCVTYRYVSWEGDFSGYRISARQNARRRWWDEGGKRAWASKVAWEMVDSYMQLVYIIYIDRDAARVAGADE